MTISYLKLLSFKKKKKKIKYTNQILYLFVLWEWRLEHKTLYIKWIYLDLSPVEQITLNYQIILLCKSASKY